MLTHASDTTLATKLGISGECGLMLVGAPEGYWELQQPIPASVRLAGEPSASSSIVHLFATKLALPLGFVDVKVCAVNETWAGLKLVVRKELR